ncbi:lipoprotein chaperone [Pseudomonas aeruginosa]|nr:lipoprotein chaperone [Pseudomonas aeruginosa]
MRLIRTLFVAALAMGASLAHADDSAAVQRLTGLLNKAQTLTARFFPTDPGR